jgi:hypothetical protein
MRVDQAVPELRDIATKLTCAMADNPAEIDINQRLSDVCGILISNVEVNENTSCPVKQFVVTDSQK